MRSLAFLLIAGWPALAQTQVDLKLQSKDVDFSTASQVKPFPAGTVLPSSCAPGSMFFKSDSAGGANIYGCVAANTWALESAGANIPLALLKLGSAITIGQGCNLSTPCMVRMGPVVYAFSGQATVTVSGGAGNVYFYVDRAGALTAAVAAAGSPSIACSGCQAVSGVAQFPADSLPLGTWNVTSGTWDAAGTDARAILSAGVSFQAGPNVTLAQAGGTMTISASLATLPTGSKPACAAGTSGSMWYTPGATGVKDNVEVCAKDAANAYAWRTIY